MGGDEGDEIIAISPGDHRNKVFIIYGLYHECYSSMHAKEKNITLSHFTSKYFAGQFYYFRHCPEDHLRHDFNQVQQ